MQPPRPKIRVPRTTTELVLEAFALLGMVVLGVVAVSTWRHSRAWEPLALGAAIYATLTVLSWFPHEYNYLVPITEANAAAQYRNTRSTLAWVKVEVVAGLAWIQWASARSAQARPPGVGLALVVPLVALVLAMILTIAFHMYRAVRLR